ncbi:FMN-binding glutamate synthase family protein [Yoonia sp. 208BN28-4]|uniref:FMN-binding glutamate synthase family protein n=1 Tax=Yoonia sp. 208BN28-4 TaxID=3126505 RepID=UPI00309B90FA
MSKYLTEQRYYTFVGVGVLAVLSLLAMFWSGWMVIPFVVFAFLTALGFKDINQNRHAILRNYPVLGHVRFLLEWIRPEMRQYFLESDSEEIPFSRDDRSLVYQRAKGDEDKRPFGTRERVYEAGYSWLTHSIVPTHFENTDFRVQIGGSACKKPYNASLYNISAMSFGSLSANAISALNQGAKMGGFAHDTGEGGISRYHREGGGDLIWEIGSGYFGCRTKDGQFNPDRFAEQAADDQIKMIEIKLSQGAKPGHGGVLPAAKITPEIAEARDIEMGKDCVSPASHPAFSDPMELVQFIGQLRELSGGKPIGFKLCIGHRREFMCIVKAMLETGIAPDFIVVDGTEGGTGAAPVEFSNHVGMPMVEGLTFVHNTLRGAGLRDEIKIGVAGKVTSAFDIARALGLGADWCNAARGYMFAIGCIQAQACHTNHCPVGVTTTDPERQKALHVETKSKRVARFHANTLEALGEMAGAAGLDDPRDFLPYHFMQRDGDSQMKEGSDSFPYLEEGFLLRDGDDNPEYRKRWKRANAHDFAPPE